MQGEAWIDEAMKPLVSLSGSDVAKCLDTSSYNRIREAVQTVGPDRGRQLVAAIERGLKIALLIGSGP